MKRRIVIADDDPLIISLIRLRLEMEDFEVFPARNGEEALTLIRGKKPVAAILDFQIPRKSGMDVLGAVKADPDTNKMPVMMLTGERDNNLVMRAMGAGDFILKPFQPDRLLERLNRMVQTSVRMATAAMPRHKPAPVWEL